MTLQRAFFINRFRKNPGAYYYPNRYTYIHAHYGQAYFKIYFLDFWMET